MATDLDRTVTVGMTGASGAQYGLRLVECLLQADWTVYLTFTRAAQIVIGSETDCRLPGRTAEQTRHLTALFKAREGQLRVFGDEEWTSQAFFILAKHRNGPVGEIPMKWTGELTRFESLTDKLNSGNENDHQK